MGKVLIAAGGTGGHIIPALAVARRLRQKKIAVHWVGSSRPLEQRLVKPEFPLECLSIEGLRGRSRWQLLTLPWRLFKALSQSFAILYKAKPDVVLTLGSFVSGPIGLMAWLMRIPLVVHEQNSISGMTNNFLQKLASQTLSAFPAAFKSYRPIKVVGNPLREEFLSAPEPDVNFEVTAKLKILVLGGSQGATAINKTVSAWLQQYDLADAVELKHQCGVKDLPELQRRYAALDVMATAYDFIDDMVAAYRWADIVIGRSGALTVAEIAAIGIASILVPFPYAVDNHQYYNAKYLEDAAAAIIVAEAQLTPEMLSTVLFPLIENRQAVVSMALAARSVAKLSATDDCLAVLDQYLGGAASVVIER